MGTILTYILGIVGMVGMVGTLGMVGNVAKGAKGAKNIWHSWVVEKTAVIWDALLAARIDVAVVKVGADEELGGAARDALEKFGY